MKNIASNYYLVYKGIRNIVDRDSSHFSVYVILDSTIIECLNTYTLLIAQSLSVFLWPHICFFASKTTRAHHIVEGMELVHFVPSYLALNSMTLVGSLCQVCPFVLYEIT